MQIPTSEEVTVAQDVYMSDFYKLSEPERFINILETYASLRMFGDGDGFRAGWGFGSSQSLHAQENVTRWQYLADATKVGRGSGWGDTGTGNGVGEGKPFGHHFVSYVKHMFDRHVSEGPRKYLSLLAPRRP
jgi:hypothetical protein